MAAGSGAGWAVAAAPAGPPMTTRPAAVADVAGGLTEARPPAPGPHEPRSGLRGPHEPQSGPRVRQRPTARLQTARLMCDGLHAGRIGKRLLLSVGAATHAGRALMARLNDSDPEVRQWAARVLAGMANPRVWPVWQRCCATPIQRSAGRRYGRCRSCATSVPPRNAVPPCRAAGGGFRRAARTHLPRARGARAPGLPRRACGADRPVARNPGRRHSLGLLVRERRLAGVGDGYRAPGRRGRRNLPV